MGRSLHRSLGSSGWTAWTSVGRWHTKGERCPGQGRILTTVSDVLDGALLTRARIDVGTLIPVFHRVDKFRAST